MIIICKRLNGRAFGMQVYYSPCEIYGCPVIIPAYLALADIRWVEAETPVFTHINTSVSTRDASQCELGLGLVWMNIRSVALGISGFSRRGLLSGVQPAARAPGGLADWGCNGLTMNAKASQPASHRGSQCGAQMYSAFPLKATRRRL